MADTLGTLPVAFTDNAIALSTLILNNLDHTYFLPTQSNPTAATTVNHNDSNASLWMIHGCISVGGLNRTTGFYNINALFVLPDGNQHILASQEGNYSIYYTITSTNITVKGQSVGNYNSANLMFTALYI